MTEYQPGTVAVATVRGVPNSRIFLADPSDSAEWTSAGLVEGNLWHHTKDITDVRPLVVLDIPAGVVPSKLAAALRDDDFLWLAEQIEAQTKPPRIPEPGLWGVVKARVGKSGTEWHGTKFPDGLWHVDDGGSFYWHEFIDPVLVRDGIEDAS